MTEKEMKGTDKYCANGKDIDEYLEGTICGIDEHEHENDVFVPTDGVYEVNEPDEPETDDTYKDFL